MQEKVLQWVERMNPPLLLLRDERVPLEEKKELNIEQDVDLVMVDGVDKVEIAGALAAGKKVLLVEKKKGKIRSFLEAEDFVPHENLFVSSEDENEKKR
ncbi:hypothetical protein K0U07_02680, partial [bacterium]|nr:hypothetical protein [bacterium]